MGDRGEHEHDKIPIEVATGRRLDLTRDDLGHPGDPGLWERLHRHCTIRDVGTLLCENCAPDSPLRFLYLQERGGIRLACSYSLEQIRAAGIPESGEHHALKDKICQLAQREGLHAEQEQTGPHRARRTDVVVTGGAAPVGWEVQLSAIDQPHLTRRIRRATNDGLVPSWLTMRNTGGFRSIIDRAPACSAKELSALEVATSGDLRVFQGVKNLAIVRCTFQRTESWHRGLTCTGHHARPAPLEENRHPSLAQMITMSAAGDMVTIRWPRKLTLNYNRPWLWVTRDDAARFYDVERPCILRSGTADISTLDEARAANGPGRHRAPTASAEDLLALPSGWIPGAAGTGLGAILGNQCPRCGYTRNQHRWDCATGLSTLREPQFQAARF
jgi:hypothetical protein